MSMKTPDVSTQRHEENSNRIAHLETAMTSLAGTVENLAKETKLDFSRITKALGDLAVQHAGGRAMNWPAAAVAIAAFGLLCGFAGYVLNAQNEKVRDGSEERKLLAARVERLVEREQDRNNAMEYKTGRYDMINELFSAGRLNMSESGKLN